MIEIKDEGTTEEWMIGEWKDTGILTGRETDHVMDHVICLVMIDDLTNGELRKTSHAMNDEAGNDVQKNE